MLLLDFSSVLYSRLVLRAAIRETNKNPSDKHNSGHLQYLHSGRKVYKNMLSMVSLYFYVNAVCMCYKNLAVFSELMFIGIISSLKSLFWSSAKSLLSCLIFILFLVIFYKMVSEFECVCCLSLRFNLSNSLCWKNPSLLVAL